MAVNTFLGITSSWNTAINWSLGTVPTSSDIATFNDSSIACSIDVAVDVAGFDIQGLYPFEVSQNAFTVKVGASKFKIAGGKFLGGSANIDFNGDVEISGGDLQLTSAITYFNGTNWIKTGGTILHNNGTIYFKKVGVSQHYNSNVEDTFYKVEISKGAYDTYIDGENLLCEFEFYNHSSLSSSPELVGAIKLISDAKCITNGGLFGHGYLMFSGNNHIWQSDNANDFNSLPNIKIDCNSLTFVAGVTDAVFGFRDFDWINGTLINSENVRARWAHPYTHHIMRLKEKLKFKSIDRYSFSANHDIYIQDLLGNYTGELQVEDYDISTGSGTQVNGGRLFVTDKYKQQGGNPSSASTIALELSGTEEQFLDITSGNNLTAGSLVVNKPSGEFKLYQDNIFNRSGFDVIVLQGEVNLNGFKLSTNDRFTEFGGHILPNGSVEAGRYTITSGIFDPDTAKATSSNLDLFTDGAGAVLFPSGGTMDFNGIGSFDIQQNYTEFKGLKINKSALSHFSGTMKVSGTFEINTMGMFLTGSEINFSGALLKGIGNTAEDIISAGKFIFDGSIKQVSDFAGALPSIEINKPSEKVEVKKKLRFIQSFRIVGSGGVDMTTHNTGIISIISGVDKKLKSNGEDLGNIEFDNIGTSTFTLEDNIFGSGALHITSQSGTITFNGFKLEVEGIIEIYRGALAGTTVIRAIGVKPQVIIKNTIDWFDTVFEIEKPSGQIIAGSDLTFNNNFNLIKGVFCTNEYDLTATIIDINADAVFDKTPTSVLTGTINGVVVDVDACKKKTNFFLVV